VPSRTSGSSARSFHPARGDSLACDLLEHARAAQGSSWTCPIFETERTGVCRRRRFADNCADGPDFDEGVVDVVGRLRQSPTSSSTGASKALVDRARPENAIRIRYFMGFPLVRLRRRVKRTTDRRAIAGEMTACALKHISPGTHQRRLEKGHRPRIWGRRLLAEIEQPCWRASRQRPNGW